MLNQNTRQVLQQLSAINNSMIISYPITAVIMGKHIQAFLDVSKLNEEEFNEIGVFNFAELNSVINVIENEDITNDKGMLTIKNDTNSIKYGTTNIDIIENDCRAKVELLDKIKSNTVVMSFDLPLKELDRIKKMSGLLKELSDLIITSSSAGISLMVTSKERSANNYTSVVQGDVQEETSMALVMDTINKLPASNFKVSIYKSSKGTPIALFESTNVEGLSIIVAAKADSGI